ALPISLADFKKSEVLAIIDHHKLEIETNKPIYLLSEPVGATATIIYFKYKELGISIPEKIAGLMLSAIISDTLQLKGPTTTKKDCVAYQDLADISGVADVDRYGAEMLKAGAVINNNTPEDFINGDVKEYFIQGKRIRIAQVYVTDMAPVLEKIADIKNEMNKHIAKNYCDLFIDRKSTRLNSSHVSISYAVFCLKKKKKEQRCSSTAKLRKSPHDRRPVGAAERPALT